MQKRRENPMEWAVKDPGTLHRRVQQGLPFSVLERFRRTADLTLAEVADLVVINSRTLARRRKAGGSLQPDESDRLVRVSRVFARAIDLFGGDPAAAWDWFKKPQIALGGVRPADYLKTEVGAQEVERVIEEIALGNPF